MTSLRALLSCNIKKRRLILGLTQAKLAEKAGTSTHYIAQIEQENKFPSPEMLERIAAALEFDSPQLFFMESSYDDDAIDRFRKGVQADLENAVSIAVGTRLAELKRPAASNLEP